MKNIIISVIVVAVGLVGYFGYTSLANQNNQNDIWDYVPKSSVGIYESDNVIDIVNKIDSINFFDKLSHAFDSNDDSLFIGLFGVNTNTNILSFHITSKNEIGVLFLMEVSNREGQKEIDDFIKLKGLRKTVKQSSRKYKTINVNELISESGSLTYTFQDNILIASTTPYLVEDAIRTAMEGETLSLKEDKSELFSIAKLNQDEGNIYINGDKVDELFSMILHDFHQKSFMKSAFYDLNISNNTVLLNGFAYGHNSSSKTAIPKPIGIFEMVPIETYYVYHSSTDKINNSLNEIEDSVLDKARISKWIGEEIALIQTGVENEDLQEKMVLISTSDINEALNYINTLAERCLPQGDSLYKEVYSGIEIKELKLEEFPRKAFGEDFNGFKQAYYFVLDDYMIFGNSIYALKRLISDIEEEKTWGKSVEYSKFLESTLKEANMSYYFNMPKMWSGLLSETNDSWKPIIEKLELNKTIKKGAIQFSGVGDKYYSSVFLELNNRSTEVRESFNVESQTYFESSITTKPYLVKNHNNHTFETLVQDKLTNLYLVAPTGDVLWKDSIGDEIVSRVYQIDYYKNRKLQYLFTTSDKLHLIDRNGDYVEGFPRKLKHTAIKLSVIDYDNSKNYRFAINDVNGDIYLYDKMGRNLDGWKPKKMEDSVIEPLKHIRVRGKDFMISIQKNGTVVIMNRRGENLKGFPLDLDMSIKGQIFLDAGDNASSTNIKVISGEGRLVSINLEGEIVQTNELYKPSKNTEFTLITSHDKKSFVICRYDNQRLAILDSKGNVLVEKDYLNASIGGIQYYDLGPGNRIYSVNDTNQDYTYLYGTTGELLHQTPVNSSFELGLLDFTGSQGKIKFYIIYQDNLTVYTY